MGQGHVATDIGGPRFGNRPKMPRIFSCFGYLWARTFTLSRRTECYPYKNDNVPGPRPPNRRVFFVTEIQNLIRLATRRLMLARFMETLANGAVLGFALLLVWVLVSKAVPSLVMEWWIPAAVVAVGVFATAVIRSLGLGRDAVSVAVAIDQRLGLRDRFSTAVQIVRRDDPFAVAAVADAAEMAARPGVRSSVRAAFRPEAPVGWWVSPILLLVAVGVWTLVPQGDLLASTPSDGGVMLAKADQQANEEVEDLVAMIEENPMLAAEMEGAIDQMLQDEEIQEDGNVEETPEEVRREAIRKVSGLQDRLDEILDGDKAKMDAALRDALANLQVSSQGDEDAEALAESLAKGDFKSANEAFERLADRLEAGELDPEKAAAIKDQLQDIADQLNELADKQDAMEQALRRAGLDPELAQNPEAMKQAIDKASNLNESQKQALQEAATAQKNASQALQGLSRTMQQMAQQGQQGEEGQEGESGQQTLSELEQMQQMLQQAQSASNQAQGACKKMGQGLSQWAAGLQGQDQSQGQGQGQGSGPRSGTRSGSGSGRHGRSRTGPRWSSADRPDSDGDGRSAREGRSEKRRCDRKGNGGRRAGRRRGSRPIAADFRSDRTWA